MNYVIQIKSVLQTSQTSPYQSIYDAQAALRLQADVYAGNGWYVQRALDDMYCEMESPDTHTRFAVQIVEVGS
jgi:hypothetical protein